MSHARTRCLITCRLAEMHRWCQRSSEHQVLPCLLSQITLTLPYLSCRVMRP